MWKVLFWLAPTIAFIFWYVSQKQEQHDVKQEVRHNNFERDFAQMNAEFEGDSDNGKYWKEKAKRLDIEAEAKKAKAAEVEERTEKMMKSAAQAQDEITEADLKSLQNMGMNDGQ